MIAVVCYFCKKFMEEEKNMSVLEHLEELRWRLVRSVIAVVIFAVVIWFFQGWIMENLFLAMKYPSFPTFQLMCDVFGLCVEEVPMDNQNTEMTGQFSYALMMSFMGGVVVAFPYIFYQLWSFVKPGLKQNEKSAAGGMIVAVSFLFFLGILFGYFVVAPLCVQFFGSFQITESLKNDIRVSSFMSMVLSTVFYSGLLFLLPVVSYLFTRLGVITPNFLKQYRKHAIVGILILSALITPPDLISQVIVGVPIVLLYEVGILISKRVHKKQQLEEIQ